MSDPYRVLGVTPSSSDDDIREAYRNLAAKYHPDIQGQGPLSDIAETKMQEINEAYDKIMDIRRGCGKPSSEYTQQSHSGSSLFAEIRRQIQLGNLSIADDMLERIETERDAEWSFLKGSVCYARGWLNDAYHFFSNAVRMAPDNPEYRAAFSNMDNARKGKMNGDNSVYGKDKEKLCGEGICDTCQFLICADCCCECMGGDFIPFC